MKTKFSILFAILALSGVLRAQTTTEANLIIYSSGTAGILLSGTTTATGSINFNVPPANGSTLTVASSSGTQTYTFQTAISGSSNVVLINGTAGGNAGTASALAGAINGTGTNAQWGTTGTNVSLSASSSGNAITFTAASTGTAGNGVALTGSGLSTGITFSAALSGGAVGSGTNVIFNTGLMSGSFVPTAFDIVYLSGTIATGTSTNDPSVLFQTQSTTATGTLTLNSNLSNGNYFAIGSTTYTATGTLSGTANNQFLTGTSASVTATNIAGVINGSGTNANWASSGTNVSVSGSASGNVVILTGSGIGTPLNAVTLSGDFSSPSTQFFNASTLTGGNTGVTMSGTILITGSTAGNLTHAAVNTAPLPYVITSPVIAPGGLQIQMKTTATGTASSPLIIKVYTHGYWMNP